MCGSPVTHFHSFIKRRRLESAEGKDLNFPQYRCTKLR